LAPTFSTAAIKQDVYLAASGNVNLERRQSEVASSAENAAELSCIRPLMLPPSLRHKWPRLLSAALYAARRIGEA
jgi:hypothetical protein